MRMTGGSGGGRRLRAPRGLATRPTSARTREAIFNIVCSRWAPRWAKRPDPVTEDPSAPLAGARVLDLYAGAGTLGLEALSRGAQSCVFVDRGAPSVATVRRNLEALAGEAGPSRARVIRGEVAREVLALGRGGQSFELVFLDPPYESDEAERALAALDQAAALAPGGVVVLEHAWRRQAPEQVGQLVRVDERRYGDTAVAFYRLPEGADDDAQDADNEGGTAS